MPTVLIVDDHPPSRQFLSTLMGYAGHRVLEASDGISALQSIRANHPDLVISDIQMPNMDGQELVRALKADPEFENLPVIFYTATFRESRAREIAASCGVKLVITKPAEPEFILNTVKGVLGVGDLLKYTELDGDSVMTVHAASLQLSAVIELGMALTRERDQQQLLALFCRGVMSILGAGSAMAGVLSEDLTMKHFIAVNRGNETANLKAGMETFLGSLLGEYREGKLDAAQLSKLAGEPPFQLSSAHSVLSAPIGSDSRIYGWVYVADKAGSAGFSIEDERMVATLAAQGAVAYENLLFCEEIQAAENLLRESEAQLRQSQKMEAVGRLAGGVAHDFNNLLTIILGYSNMLLEECPAGSHLQLTVAEIRKAGERAAGLTRQLLAFSKKALVRPVILDLNELVVHTEKMLQRLIGEDIEIEFKADPDLRKIKADPGQIEQILLNLAVNARDAMARGGKLTIETANHGDQVLLEMGDSGCGMSPEVLAQIFEPFFTTKDSGTGLGLSMIYGIVHQAGGQIEVQSEIGLGTTFRIYLPRADASAVEPDEAKAAEYAGNGETILLVEDEEMVRNLTEVILKQHGYHVLAIGSGPEALQISKDYQGKIDLLLTDVVMPQMSGRELRDQVIEGRPDIRVLFMSGYLDDAVMRHGIRESEVAFIQKPFVPDTLVGKVRSVLAAEDACR